MKEIEVGAGEHISRACRIAIASGVPCFFKFNDVLVEHLDEKETAKDLEAQWHTKFEAACQAYRNSPKGKQAAADADRRSRENQARMDRLMSQLPTFTKVDHYAVLSWFEEFIDVADHIGVDCDKNAVVRTFIKLGYLANVNTEEDFRAEDRDNVARYLVGQCLGGLSSKGFFGGMIWPGAIGMIQDWKKKFGR